MAPCVQLGAATDLLCPRMGARDYVEREFNKANYIAFRNEYFDDMNGQPTGFKTKYYAGFLGYGTTMLFSPELRYQHSFHVPAYSSGTKKSQFIFASDVIFFFCDGCWRKTYVM